MASYRVVCITKPDVQSSNEHITRIGYYESALRPKVIITVEEAIQRIDRNSTEFYVSTPAGTAYVKVERPNGRRPYIRTVPDRTEKDNLLSLPQC
ncbi:DUF3892 domain-containing protein [Pedobacter sp. Hv1]|uniref:DUF3892 domain-containing protein n=1 Tax=Pedobacter sp. Hv1 TaxID=1740090 RepID=UPI0006D89D80|nr:hypothetical protein AQF98_05175 [Pedobacter sp. Hv1]